MAEDSNKNSISGGNAAQKAIELLQEASMLLSSARPVQSVGPSRSGQVSQQQAHRHWQLRHRQQYNVYARYLHRIPERVYLQHQLTNALNTQKRQAINHITQSKILGLMNFFV